MWTMTPTTSARSLAALLGTAGVFHFVTPSFFDAIVPRSLPGSARAWTHVSGVAELAVAGAVAHPRTRRGGAMAAAALFVAVFPANVQAAVDAEPGPERVVTLARLPLQVPLVLWALRVSRRSSRRGT
jgi:uncharacterized membrane protein